MDRRALARPQRVLLVDDSADMREMWSFWLRHWGFAVVEASNGAEAVVKAIARPPDLVLMDLWMPVLDGLEATRRLKADSRTAQVPIVTLSAQGLIPNAASAQHAGAAAFVLKPCEPDDLLRHLRGVMGKRSPEPSSE